MNFIITANTIYLKLTKNYQINSKKLDSQEKCFF